MGGVDQFNGVMIVIRIIRILTEENTMSKEYKTLMTEIRLPYELAYGPVWTRFFEGMAEKKIFGPKCTKCVRILVPARSFCPRCFIDTDEWGRGGPDGNAHGRGAM